MNKKDWKTFFICSFIVLLYFAAMDQLAWGVFYIVFGAIIAIVASNNNKNKEIEHKQINDQNKQEKIKNFYDEIAQWKTSQAEIQISNYILSKNYSKFYLEKQCYLKSVGGGKGNKVILGMIYLTDKEIIFLADSKTKIISYNDILSVQLGIINISFSSRKAKTPCVFYFIDVNNIDLNANKIDLIDQTINACEVFAKWNIINNFPTSSYEPKIQEILAAKMPNINISVKNTD